MTAVKKRIPLAVIVPIYNVERYLSECLDSILGQTYKDFVIFAVDDGSTDESAKIADDYALKDSRVVVIHKINGGLSSARNAAINEIFLFPCKFNYIYFLDSDDVIEENFLERMLFALRRDASDIAVSSVIEFSKDQEIKKRAALENDLILDQDGFASLYFEMNGWHRTDVSYRFLGNKIFKAELIEGILFDENFKTAEDQDWILRHILPKVSCVTVVPNATFRYRLRKSSLSKKNKILQDFHTFSDLVDMASSYTKSARQGIQNRYFETLHAEVKSRFIVGDDLKRWEILREVKKLPLRKWEFPLSFKNKKKVFLARLPINLLRRYLEFRYRNKEIGFFCSGMENFFE